MPLTEPLLAVVLSIKAERGLHKEDLKMFFLKIIFLFMLLITVVVIVLCSIYEISVSAIARLTNGDKKSAERKIQRWFDKWIYRKEVYDLSKDTAFIHEIEQSVENILGKKRFDSLCALGATGLDIPLLYFGQESGLQFVAITFPYADDTEQRRIERISSNLAIRYLRVHGQNDSIITAWQKRADLDIAVFKIRYSITEEQDVVLKNMQEYDRRCMILRYQEIIDVEDENDLT